MANSMAICPYCHKVLEQRPKRKKKCPFCKQFIFMLTVPSKRERVLVTEVDAKEIDQEWQKIQLQKMYNITDHEFEQ